MTTCCDVIDLKKPGHVNTIHVDWLRVAMRKGSYVLCRQCTLARRHEYPHHIWQCSHSHWPPSSTCVACGIVWTLQACGCGDSECVLLQCSAQVIWGYHNNWQCSLSHHGHAVKHVYKLWDCSGQAFMCVYKTYTYRPPMFEEHWCSCRLGNAWTSVTAQARECMSTGIRCLGWFVVAMYMCTTLWVVAITHITCRHVFLWVLNVYLYRTQVRITHFFHVKLYALLWTVCGLLTAKFLYSLSVCHCATCHLLVVCECTHCTNFSCAFGWHPVWP